MNKILFTVVLWLGFISLHALHAEPAASNNTLTFKAKEYTAEIKNGCLTTLRDKKGRTLVAEGDFPEGISLKWNNKDYRPNREAITASAQTGSFSFAKFAGLPDAQMEWNANLDSASNDLIVVQNAQVSNPGLESAEWTIGYVPLDYNILIPAGGGEIMTKDSPFKKRSFFYALGWDAQLLVIEGKGHGFYIWGDDTQARPKTIAVERTERGWKITCRTINEAPFTAQSRLDPRRWRINVYEGDWRVPARRYRDWAEQEFKPVKLADQQPAWVKDTRVFVYMLRLELPLLEELAKQLDPKQTLIYLSHWRQQQFDRDCPNYDQYTKELLPFITRAHELGFRIILHTNFWGLTPEHPLMTEFAPYQVRSEQGQLLRYQNLNHKPPVVLNYISPASKRWREEFIARMKKLAAETGTDGIHLDQNFHSHNDNNGRIDGLSFNQGVLALHRELREALPQIAFSGEGLNELTYRYLAFAQRHVWSAMGGTVDRAALSVAHPISSYLCQPYVRHYGWLGLPFAHELSQSYSAWRENYKDWGVYPTFRYQNEMSPALLRHPGGFYKQLVNEAKFFQQKALEPNLDSDWPEGVAFAFRAKDGQPVYWTKDRRLMEGDREISRTLTDVSSAKLPGTIDQWLFYDQTTLYGLKPDIFYAYFTQPRDPNALHILKTPSWLTPDFARKTSDFLLVSLDRNYTTLFDLVQLLPKSLCGLNLDSGEKYQETGAITGRYSANLSGAFGTLAMTPPSRAALSTDLESTVANTAAALGDVYASYRVSLPKTGETWFLANVGMDGRSIRTTKSDGMKFIMRATAGEITLEQAVENKTETRAPLELNLSRLNGKEITIQLIGQAGPAKNATEDRGIWYLPRIVQPIARTSEPLQIANAPANWQQAFNSTGPLTITREGPITQLSAQTGTTVLANRPCLSVGPGSKLATLARTVTTTDLWNWPIEPENPQPTIETQENNLIAFLPVRTMLTTDWLLTLPSAPAQFRTEIENLSPPGGVGTLIAKLMVNDHIAKKITLQEKGPHVMEANLSSWAGQPIVLTLALEGKARRGDFKLRVQNPRIESLPSANP